MPLPIGHVTIGLTAYSFCGGREFGCSRWKVLLAIFTLSNLPDVDVLLGIVFAGNGNAFHRGPTHSLIFVFIGGLLAHGLCRLWSRLPKLSLGICLLLILSHILSDALLTNSPISFFWPITVHWSAGHSGLRDVVKLVLFANYQDWKIIIACASLLLLRQVLMAFGIVGGLQKSVSQAAETGHVSSVPSKSQKAQRR